MKKTLAILGAIDRFNYGDLLFPLLIEEALQNVKFQYQFEYFGFKRSDLSATGAKKTKSIRDLIQQSTLKDGDVLLVAGGDVLGINWMPMHLHQLKFLQARVFESYFKFFGKALKQGMAINARLAKRYGAESFVLPWIIPRSAFKPGVRIVYNTVSGSKLHTLHPAYRSYLKENLNGADLISVRDSVTRNQLIQIGIEIPVSLVPDSAVIMSQYYPIDRLKSMIRPEIQDWIDSHAGRYLCFQVKQSLEKRHLQQIVRELEAIYNTQNLNILLLPIGRVPMHEDHLILKKVKDRLKVPCFLPQDLTLFEIMYCIASSNLYIGTSLHGVVTALSFSVPHLGIIQDTPKLAAFLNDWDIDALKQGIRIDEINKKAAQAIGIDKKELKGMKDYLMGLVLDHYKRIYSEILPIPN
ncbi:polysaccharide pyruvyl transferase family protein [candidate division KSB1 bacterium]|nr:polysaccharide pyruvyl transferase family protein [candidate division KSB1 bacterium]